MNSLPPSPTASALFLLTHRSSSLGSASSATSHDSRLSISRSLSRMSSSATDISSSSCQSPPLEECTDATAHLFAENNAIVTVTCSTSITDITNLSPGSPRTFSGGTKSLFARRRTVTAPTHGLGLGDVSTATGLPMHTLQPPSLHIAMPTKTSLRPLASPGGCSPSPMEPLPSPVLGRLRVRRPAPGVLAAATGTYPNGSPLTAHVEFPV